MTLKRLSDEIKFHLNYQDDTLFGSAISHQAARTVRTLCDNIVRQRQDRGLQDLITRSWELLDAAMTGGLAELYVKPNTLRSEWLYPAVDRVNPVAIELERGIGEIFAQIELPPELFSDLATYLGEWELGATAPLDPIACQLWAAFEELGVLIPVEEQSSAPNLGNATLIGHSTVRLGDGTTTILFDPFLLPKADIYPSSYQPLSIRELGKIDGVFITHSHPDHFDLGTLLRLGRDLPIFVPKLERESVLSIDMEFRLGQLGFQNVRSLNWFEEVQIGDMRIVTLPFYGEQPTTGDILHPEVRNQGNTYLIDFLERRIVLTADSGTDCLGSIKQMAITTGDRYGSIDTIFGGYRGFGLYPIQYLFSSIAAYLPFIPSHLWRVRQQMMGNADDAIDLAEIWNANRIVPYSDGGAPWYWLRGFGPCLDGSEDLIMSVDPTPDYVATVATQRSGTKRDGAIASPVSICLLRPGEALAFEGKQTSIHTKSWPYSLSPQPSSCPSTKSINGYS
jgi:L-ascorbate metabolism protein UlaG (beta-lactamase superfamily)